jgi:hypothetical protein
MYAASILKGIHDPELREQLHLDDHGPDTESPVNWTSPGIIQFESRSSVAIDPEAKPRPLAPTELLREFYLSIAIHGLEKTYKSATILKPHQLPKPKTPSCIEKKKKGPVIIVGAGMAGLVAGYELKNAGYEVNILEMSERFGGRVKTLGQKEGFDRGLFADGELYACM